MRFTLEIDMDNAAFADDFRPELERLLTRIAGQVERWPVAALISDPIPVRDFNGNRCGEIRFVEDTP